MILCYKCGVPIQPSESNLCARCLNNSVDLSSHVRTTMMVESCRGCGRYHSPPNSWKTLAWGSKDLLIFLLNRNKSLRKANIIDSTFLYTEEHSNKLRIEILLLKNAVEQPIILEYTIRNRQCKECMRAEANQFWKAVVQLRQHPHHRRTFMYFERLMIQHKAHLGTSNIKERRDGIDFYFTETAAALKTVEFIRCFFGVQVSESSRIISLDIKNNTANKKDTFSVELLPFCVDDLVFVTDKTFGQLNRNSAKCGLLLVKKVRNNIEFIDPVTGRWIKIPARQYFANRDDYKIVLRSDSLKKYSVVCSRRAKDGKRDVAVTGDAIHIYDLITDMEIHEDDVVYGYDLENMNLAQNVDIGLSILLVRKNKEELDEFAGEDTEMKHLLTDISSDKGMLKSVIGTLPKNPMLSNIEKMNLN